MSRYYVKSNNDDTSSWPYLRLFKTLFAIVQHLRPPAPEESSYHLQSSQVDFNWLAGKARKHHTLM